MSTALSSASLLEALQRHRLLDEAQFAEITRFYQGRSVEPRALAQKLIELGWLTPYQANQLFHGRAQDLVFGSYIVLERLGEGGMGLVFKARHRNLGRLVALKLIRKDRLANTNAVRRFHREIQLAAQLNHPNIVLAFDADQRGDAHFFTMEYVEGCDLSQLVKRSGPLSIRAACDYVRQAALGLQHAHERGLVHRDIKPSNLLLATKDRTIKILDMGLARWQGTVGDSTEGQTLTQDNAVVGTPDYIAPEQILNARTADIRADLYSLGCTLYFLLAGRVAFPGASLGEKLVKHQLHEAEPIALVRPDVPPALAAVVKKLLAKRPEDRYQTPAELAAVLEQVAAASGTERSSQRLPAVSLALPTTDTVEGAAITRKVHGLVRRRPKLLWIALGSGLGLSVLLLLSCLLLFAGRPAVASMKQPPPATASAPEKHLTNSLGMKLALIPAGEFRMGSPPTEAAREGHEGPQHTVTISRPFLMGIHEVTVGQFRAFVQATSYQTDAEREGNGSYCYAPNGDTVQDAKCVWHNPGPAQTDAHPVSCVSRADAIAFCQWLSKKEGKTYRLPTEAEWEYACRAGSTTVFHCGDTLQSAQAHFSKLASGGRGHDVLRTVKVGSFPPNAFGLHDMHGNVWEWCSDWYEEGYYAKSPPRDPTGPPGSGMAVMRGGGFEVDSTRCRSAFRFPMNLSMRHVVIGFRVVCER